VIHSIRKEGIAFREFFKFNNSALFDSNDGTGPEVELSKAQWDSALANFDGLVTFLQDLQPHAVLQRRASRALLLLLLHGHTSEIARRLVNIERFQQQLGFLESHRKKIESQAILPSAWTFHVLTLRPIDPELPFCVICNVSCDPRGPCPGRCRDVFHSYQRFRTEYEERSEQWTTGQLLAACAEGGETKVDVDRIREKLNARLAKTQRRILSHVSQARELANQVCPDLQLCSDSDYISLLIAAEKAGRQKGREGRIEQLAALNRLTAQRGRFQ
jgi:hypothetical protein